MYINIMDLVTIRVKDHQTPLVNFIQSEYTPYIQDTVAEESDIVVDFFTDKLPEGAYEVRQPVSHDDEGVFLFDLKKRICRIDFDRIGEPNLLVRCDELFDPHFLAIILEYLVHIYMIRHEAFFCHCCAFEYGGKVFLCPAWRNIGKTNLLLSLLDAGASYIADDWCLVFADGRIRSLSKRLNLFYYNFLHFPKLAVHLEPEYRHLVDFTTNALNGHYDLDNSVLDTLCKRLRVRVTPQELGVKNIIREAEKVDALFLLRKSTNPSPQVSVSQLSFEALCNILYETINFEHSYFRLAYSVHKEQTGRRNSYLEAADALLYQMICTAFKKVTPLQQIEIPSQDFALLAKDAILQTAFTESKRSQNNDS